MDCLFWQKGVKLNKMATTTYSNYIEKKHGFDETKETIELSDFLRDLSFREVSYISRFGYAGETCIYHGEHDLFLVRSQFEQVDTNRRNSERKFYCHSFAISSSDQEQVAGIIEKLMAFYSGRGYSSNPPVESER